MDISKIRLHYTDSSGKEKHLLNRIKKGKIRYIELQFHDNDYSYTFLKVLKEFYEWIQEDIENYSYKNNNKTVSDVFIELNNNNELAILISHMAFYEVEKCRAHGCVRGISYRNNNRPILKDIQKGKWQDKLKLKLYLQDIKFVFYKEGEDIDTDRNSEFVLLDLEVGRATTL